MRRKCTILVLVVLLLTNIETFAASPVGNVEFLEKSDPDYIFTVKGSNRRFLLLDTTNDKNSKFLLMGIDYYGQGVFDGYGNQRYDTENSSNAGYILNKTLIDEGLQQSFTKVIYKIPNNVVEHINFNHEWLTQGGNANGNAKKDYKTVCGINLLSQEELLKYKSIIGTKDDIFDGGYTPKGTAWWLRDGDKSSKSMLAVRISGEIRVGLWGSSDNSAQYRPIFYVDRDFFSEVPIELSSAGKEVLAVFNKQYTIGELKKIYEEKELYDILQYAPDIKVNALSYSDGQKEISSIKGVDHIIANVDITNNAAMAKSGILIMAYYDAYGRSIKVTSKKMLISSGETRDSSLELQLDKVADEGSYIKITFLDGNKLHQSNNSLKLYY